MRYPMFAVLATALVLLATSASRSQEAVEPLACDQYYTVESGDSLGYLALRAYGDAFKHTVIFYRNRDAIGENPSLIYIGANLFIPCLDVDGVSATNASIANTTLTAAAPVTRGVAPREEIFLLTGSDYRPYTDQTWHQGGMITEIVRAALDNQDTAPPYRIMWVNDWSAHFTPLLSEKMFDLGFPWLKPPQRVCEGDPEKMSEQTRERCQFRFSDPLFEIVTPMWHRADDPFEPVAFADLEGKVLCRPSGYYTFDLEEKGLVAPVITLVQPEKVQECFTMLLNGEVDMVSITEFVGRDTIRSMGVEDRIEARDRLALLNGLHIIAHKSHPRAEAFLTMFNQALQNLKQTQAYDEIVTRHLALFYGLKDTGDSS